MQNQIRQRWRMLIKTGRKCLMVALINIWNCQNGCVPGVPPNYHFHRSLFQVIYFLSCQHSDLIYWFRCNAVFNNNVSVMPRRSFRLPMCFLAFPNHYSTQVFPSNWLLSPLVVDQCRFSQWHVSNVRKNVSQTGVRTHNDLIDRHHLYRLKYRCTEWS